MIATFPSGSRLRRRRRGPETTLVPEGTTIAIDSREVGDMGNFSWASRWMVLATAGLLAGGCGSDAPAPAAPGGGDPPGDAGPADTSSAVDPDAQPGPSPTLDQV